LSISDVLPTIHNENDFVRPRYLLLNRPTIPEYQIASRIAEAIKSNPTEEINDPLVKARLNKQSKFDNNIIIHYTYEKRLQNNKTYLHHRHQMPPKSLAIQQLSNHLQTLLYKRYHTSLSYLDIYRTRRDQKLMLSIKRKLKDGNHILRVTYKSGVFHIGQKVDYDRKVERYQKQTGAYIELSSNPLMNTFYKVVRLLNDLNTKKHIREWQYKKIMPDSKKIKLAYLYFVPKPHKVSSIPSI
jgi:hypothetical protein